MTLRNNLRRSIGLPLLFGALFLMTPQASQAGVCDPNNTDQCDAFYDPVCGNWDTGIRCVTAPCPSAEQRLYTNACLACQNKRVTFVQPGECSERREPKVGQRKRVELSDLIGRRTQKDRGNTIVDVDLEVSETLYVTRAWVIIEGVAMKGSAESLDSAEGVIEMPVKVQIAIKDSFGVPVFDVAQPLALLGPFEGSFKAEGVLAHRNAPLAETNWSTLNDGKTQLQLSFPPACRNGCRYLEDAVMDIQRAELVVDFVLEGDR
jgi:hypothetical protein